MPVTKVRDPDGRLVKVAHPEGATQKEIIRYAQMSHESRPTDLSSDNSIRLKRERIGGGELQFGPFKTGIKTSQAFDEALAGAGKRLAEIGTLGFHEADPEVDKMLTQSVPGMLGGMASDVVTGAGIGRLVPGTGLSGAKTFKHAAAGGAVYGGATVPERFEGVLGGGIGGGLGHGLTKALAKTINPEVSPAAREIIDEGGTLTPGELFGGAAKRAEDAATSIPVLGDAVRSAQRGSLQDFNVMAINKALAPIGESLDSNIPAGREAIAKADELVSKTYEKILSGMDVQMDQQFVDEINNLFTMVGELPSTSSQTV